jgi:acetyl-CoA decarbonylase/synthase complex subunit gamma
MGLAWTVLVLAFHRGLFQPYGTLNAMALLFLLPAISAFLTLNFTGASTYTSLSGVKREMRFALPVIIASASGGVGLWVVGLFT